jgi:type 1 glutamine amidotransferase
MISSKRFAVLALAVLSVAVWATVAPAAHAAEGKIKLLYVGHGGHDWKGFAAVLGEVLDKTGDFKMTVAQSLDELKAGNLRKYDVVLFYGSGRNFTDPAQEQGLDAFVRAGGGLAGVHATDAFKKSDVYWHLMAGRFTTHGGGKFPVVIVDKKHPITAGIEDFEISDETYQNSFHPKAKIHSLLRCNRGREQQTMAWVQQVGKGRVFCTTLGHGKAAWDNPAFQRLVVRGLYWAAGRTPKDPKK